MNSLTVFISRWYLKRSWQMRPNDGRSSCGSKSSNGKITKSMVLMLSTESCTSTLTSPIEANFSSDGIDPACRRWVSFGQKRFTSCPALMRPLPTIKLVALVGNMTIELGLSIWIWKWKILIIVIRSEIHVGTLSYYCARGLFYKYSLITWSV